MLEFNIELFSGRKQLHLLIQPYRLVARGVR